MLLAHLFLNAGCHRWAGLLADAAATQPSEVHALNADTVLSPYIFVFYAAFLTAFVFTPIMRLIATHYNIIDHPDRMRKMHNVPVAYLGGVAVFLGWMAGLALSQFVQLHRNEPGTFPHHVVINLSIIIGAVLIVLLGLIDDVRKAPPWVKIAGQTAAALMLLYNGIGTHLTAVLFSQLDRYTMSKFGWPPVSESVVIITSSMVVIIVVVGCCNATNLMDGLDGLCGGVTAVIAAGFLFLAVHLAVAEVTTSPNLDGLRVVLALSLLGAVLGFIPFNFNPASIFMGDAGSMFLGFACAVMIILSGEGELHPKWFLASVIMFALPILDTALAFARRWVNRRPFFSADKHHFHHQLVARGFSVKQAVVISYALAFFFALAGSSIAFMRTRYAVAFYLVIFGSLIVAAFKMGMVHEKASVRTRKSLSDNVMAVASPNSDAGQVLELRDSEGGKVTGRAP